MGDGSGNNHTPNLLARLGNASSIPAISNDFFKVFEVLGNFIKDEWVWGQIVGAIEKVNKPPAKK
jgi:hypothetical protein